MGEKQINLGLTALDELFMTEAGRKEALQPKIQDIPIELIDDFPNHPFQARLDEDMGQLVESIKQNGIITPVPPAAKGAEPINRKTGAMRQGGSLPFWRWHRYLSVSPPLNHLYLLKEKIV